MKINEKRLLRFVLMLTPLCLFAVAGSSAWAVSFTVSPLFSDHAVLQRDRSIIVWGTADPGEQVQVRFHGNATSAKSDAAGTWSATLPAMAADAKGSDLEVNGPSTFVAHDVVVGEVWICSGQSNMGFEMSRVLDAKTEIAAANYPLIRHVAIEGGPAARPVSAVRAGGWQPATPAVVSHFTAVGYYFAQELYNKLQVPIGLIRTTVGGTPVEAWMSPGSFSKSAELLELQRRESTGVSIFAPPQNRANAGSALTTDEAPGSANKLPSVLFNGKVAALKPYVFRGVLWYQGEANANHNASDYYALFPALITGWREFFGVGDFPFYWVQLPNFSAQDAASRKWARVREAEADALKLPHTGQAVSVDVGENKNLHPLRKQPVGHRLAVLAERDVYGLNTEAEGPTFMEAQRDGSSLRVTLSHAQGLQLRGDALPTWEIAGADGNYVPATAKIDGESLLVSAAEVAQPAFVRYAFTDAPVASYYNSAELPMAPFRSSRDNK